MNPETTVIIPTYQEAEKVSSVLQRLLGQDYPVSKMEIIVVDGCSSDDTMEQARLTLSKSSVGSWQVISNPGRTIPSNLNVGLQAATGEYIVRVDGRTILPENYVTVCVQTLKSESNIAVVGGRPIPIALNETAKSIGIARALNNKWGMGGAAYKTGKESGPTETVYLGAFRTQQLRDIGGWDERLTINEDFDLNQRMQQYGDVWLDHTLRCGYQPRQSIVEIWKQYKKFGQAKVKYWRLSGEKPQKRQWVMLIVPPIAVVSGVFSLILLPSSFKKALLALGAISALIVEESGVSEPKGGLLTRIYSTVISVGIASAWLLGVFTQLASKISPSEGE